MNGPHSDQAMKESDEKGDKKGQQGRREALEKNRNTGRPKKYVMSQNNSQKDEDVRYSKHILKS